MSGAAKLTLSVSTGVRIILNAAAAKLAKTVFRNAGRRLKYTFEVRRASIPTLAAVSPNRATGPTCGDECSVGCGV